jgi:hypothetical protein
MHRNITFRRLVLDLYQFVRAQKPVMHLLGTQFSRSLQFVEIDITYRCNLKCNNCNRSCTQAPSRTDISLNIIKNFLEESASRAVPWRRIRVLGGEPTLHPRFYEIIEMLLEYKSTRNPCVRLVVCTNSAGPLVHGRLARLPTGIIVKSTDKGSRQRLFRPFNMAPVDNTVYRLSEFSAGCRIISDCGLGLTPSGYYPCAVAGGIDRVLGFGAGRSRLPAETDDMRDLMALFCRYCGHFGFLWPVRRQKMSPFWIHAYRAYHQHINMPNANNPRLKQSV